MSGLFASVEQIELGQIERDMALQPRASLHHDWIEEYALDMREGAEFPPVVVFFDGEKYWLADGFHRVFAAEAAGLTAIQAEVREGGRRGALLFSVGANAQHGHRRTNEDKRRAVDIMLNDPEWCAWSDREIARQCAVDNSTVSRRRQELSVAKQQIGASVQPPEQPRKVTRRGTTYEMHTGGINEKTRRRRVVEPPEEPADPEAARPFGWLCEQCAQRSDVPE
jgi:hypothetical protein